MVIIVDGLVICFFCGDWLILDDDDLSSQWVVDCRLVIFIDCVLWVDCGLLIVVCY